MGKIMKKIIPIFIILLIVLCIPSENYAIEVSRLTMDKESIVIDEGQSEQLNVTLFPKNGRNKKIIWESMDEEIASVDRTGKVTGNKKGVTIITATTSNRKMTRCRVQVIKREQVEITSLKLSQNKLNIVKGQTANLSLSVEPQNAKGIDSLIWNISNESIITENTRTMNKPLKKELKALSNGVATITVSTPDGKLKDSATITVVDNDIERLNISKTYLLMNTGETKKIEISWTQSTSVVIPDVDLALSKEDIVSYKVESINNEKCVVAVSAEKVGRTKLSATILGREVSCDIVVLSPEIEIKSIRLDKDKAKIKVGEGIQLTASIIPENATKLPERFLWSVSNDRMEEVLIGDDSNELQYTTSFIAKKAGISTIIVKIPGTNISAHCIVTIEESEVDVKSITLDKKDIELKVGETDTLKATIEPEDATDKSIIWKSNNEDIVEVDENGNITAKKEGVAIISVLSSNGKIATAVVRVKSSIIPISNIRLDQSYFSMYMDQEKTLIATIEPENATDKTIVWSSSNENIMEVDNGKIICKNRGTAIIVATASNGLKASCIVTINEIEAESIELNKDSMVLTLGNSDTLLATVKPDNTTYKNITWSCSDREIVDVINGVVIAKKVGTAKVTALTSNGKTATCTVTVKGIPVSNIKLNKTSLLLEKGKSENLVATIEPENATDKSITWISSNNNIVEVNNNGKIVAKNVGSATVTAISSNGLKASCTITVKEKAIEPSSIKLNKTSITLDIGKSTTLVATIEPTNATNKTIKWKSSDNSVVEVNNGKVTAKKAGEASITATTSNGKTATCIVKVNKAQTQEVTGITLKQKDHTINVGESLQLVATIEPSNAANKTISWSSSNDKVATVSKSGVVKGINAGKVTITAKTNNNKTATCIIRVSIPAKSISINKKSTTLSVGSTEKLSVTFNPTNTSSKEITWTSSNKSIVTVNSDGLITAKAKGKATITATSKYGKTATCEVTVNDKILYVSKNGSDSNNGKTTNTAFKTIKKGISQLSPGYKLVIAEGTYYEHDLKIKLKGTSSEPIKIVANGNVKIDGSGKKLLLKISSSENITIDGIKFQNLNAKNSYGVLIEPKCKNITISNCKFENIKTTKPKGENDGSSAIYVNGTSSTAIDNITIKNCSLYNIQAGYSEAISIDGNCTNIKITGVSVNYSGMKGNIGICICGGYGTCSKKELDRPRNVEISNCTVKNCKSPYDENSAFGIYVDGGKNIKIHNNLVEDCEGGIEIGAEKSNSKFKGKETDNVEVYNNTIKNCNRGMQIGGWDGKATVYKCTVKNNTFKNCGHNGGKTIEISKTNYLTITNNSFSTKESKTFEYNHKSAWVKNYTKSGNTYGK